MQIINFMWMVTCTWIHRCVVLEVISFMWMVTCTQIHRCVFLEFISFMWMVTCTWIHRGAFLEIFLCPLHRDVDNISLMYPEIPVINFMALFLLFSFLREVVKDCFNCWWPVKWCWNLGFLEMICDCRHCFFTICCVRRDNFINVLLFASGYIK